MNELPDDRVRKGSMAVENALLPRFPIILLPNILPETLVTVDHVRCVAGIHRDHGLAALVTRPLIELAFTPKRHPLAVTTCGAMIREWQFLLVIKLGFGGNDNEGLAAGRFQAGQLDRLGDCGCGGHDQRGGRVWMTGSVSVARRFAS